MQIMAFGTLQFNNPDQKLKLYYNFLRIEIKEEIKNIQFKSLNYCDQILHDNILQFILIKILLFRSLSNLNRQLDILLPIIQESAQKTIYKSLYIIQTFDSVSLLEYSCLQILFIKFTQKIMTLFKRKKTSQSHQLNKSSIRESQSLPPISKAKIGNYIEKSLQLVQKGCYQEGKLKIDSDYGDYNMSIFRLKDRIKHLKNIPSLFTQSIVRSIHNSLPKEDLSSHAEITNLINKSNDIYMKEIQNQQKEEEVIFKKGDLQRTTEDEGYLIYKYFPKEQQRWFKIVDNSQQYESQKRKHQVNQGPQVQSIKTQKIKLKQKRNFMFKYQEYSKKQLNTLIKL